MRATRERYTDERVSLSPLPITDTRAFFRPLGRELVALLQTLSAEQWQLPTIAGSWRVRDVAAHLADVQMRRLSFHRDRHTPPAPSNPPRNEREFVAFINGLNGQWLDVSQRFSPDVLTALIATAGAALADFTEAFPLDAPALFPVSWAGEVESAGWFDIGREFTELWHHQAQIRDAVGASPASEPAWLHAVLLIALRGLPHAYREVAGARGDAVVLDITGPAGGTFTLQFETPGWRLRLGGAMDATTRVRVSDDAAWRLLFNALPSPAEARRQLAISGRADLAEPLLRARSVVV